MTPGAPAADLHGRILSELAGHTHEAVIVTDPDQSIVWVNEAFTRVTGYRADEAMGRKPGHLLQCTETNPTEVARFGEAVKRGMPVRGVLLNARKDGHRYWCDIDIKPLLDAAGELLGFMAVESDVSEAVEAAARLEEANALQRAIVDNAPASIALIDSDGRVVETNAQWDSFCRAAGLPDCRPGTDYLAACARLEAQCAAAPGDMAQACTGALSGLRTALFDVIAGRSGGFETEFPCPVDGQERYFICKIAPAPVAGGTGAVVMQIDATERRRQERALEEALARANAATEAKARFLATMSHEIRTPMNGVLGMVQTARLMGLAPEIDDMLETAETSARGLLTLIEDILDMSKLEAGRMSLTRAPFALRDLCAGVIDTLAPVARDGGLTLQCRIADDVPNAWSGDAGRLRQILFNLIGNGIKFTDKGHVSLTVRAPRHPESGRPEGLVFEIADTGIGMTDSDLAIAFDRFAQADGGLQRRHGGTGLGLAIVKELTELMGGRVDVSSRKGEGTLFTVAVPLREAETQAA